MEGKRVCSEIKTNLGDFKYLIGTMDRKNPSIVYIELNGYMVPTFNSVEYASKIEKTEKEFRKLVDKIINKNSHYFSTNSIFSFDVAEKRMSFNKKSFFSISIFFTLTNEYKKTSNFKLMADEITNLFSKYKTNIEDIFMINGFLLSKTKK